jgi:tight adherence protein B
VSSLLAGALAAIGVALLFSWVPGRSPDPREPHALDDLPGAEASGARLVALLQRLPGVPSARELAVSVALGIGAVLVCLWGSAPPLIAIVVGTAAGSIPATLRRRRSRNDRRAATAGWPQLLDDLRVKTGALGRPIPQALMEVGASGPIEMRPAFADAAREWALTTDFPATIRVLKRRLDDPTADAVCETLLVAHEVGGDLDSRLAALAEDRRTETRYRAEAEARHAGARVARWFVLVVPIGMALAGLRLGDGAAAFNSPGAQMAVAAAIAMIGGCWWWAGRIMSLPDRPRVFDR